MAKRIDEKIKDILNDKDYYDIVKDIVESSEYQRRKDFKHHEDCSVYEHMIEVSYLSYRICKKLRLNYRDAAIGGVLHDLYSRPWQDHLDEKVPFFKQHGFVHAREALDNANKFYPSYLNKRVSNIILRHMFPLNIHPPRYLESWIVSFADKKVSMNILKPNKAFLKYIGLAKFVSKK